MIGEKDIRKTAWECKEWAEAYYEGQLDLSAVQRLYDARLANQKDLAALNPSCAINSAFQEIKILSSPKYLSFMEGGEPRAEWTGAYGRIVRPASHRRGCKTPDKESAGPRRLWNINASVNRF